MEATLLLLRFNCPHHDCPHMASGWDALEKHTLSSHGLVLCSLCRRQLSRFAHEQVLYPPHLLPLHDPSRVQRGQRPPRPRGDREIELVKGWDAPHPMCEVWPHHVHTRKTESRFSFATRHSSGQTSCSLICGISTRSALSVGNWTRRMYSEPCDLIFSGHKLIIVASTIIPSSKYISSTSSAALRCSELIMGNHCSQEHFPCMQPICQEKKFQVFPSEMDLRAHMVAEVCLLPYSNIADIPKHGEQMSARDRAQARQLPIDFNSHDDSSRRNGQSRSARGGRGFTLAQNTNNNVQAGPSRARDGLPHQQQIAQPLPMVPEQAAQHRRQLQADRQEESRRRKAFVTSLTGSAREEADATVPPTAEISGSGYNTPREDIDEATAE